jgi:hypothetical protein
VYDDNKKNYESKISIDIINNVNSYITFFLNRLKFMRKWIFPDKKNIFYIQNFPIFYFLFMIGMKVLLRARKIQKFLLKFWTN